MKNSKTLTIVSGVVIVTLIVALALVFGNGVSGQTVEVSGQSTVTATPDLVTIYFNVETKGKTSQEANENNSAIVEDLTISLIKLGLENKEIQTQSFNIYPEYDWKNDGKLIGYIASHSIKVQISTEDTGMISDIIDAGIDSGAGISYINFELSQELQNQYKAEAIKLAADDAKTKAEAIATGFDKKVGRLVSTSVNEFNYYPRQIYEASGTSSDAVLAKESVANITPSDEEVSAMVTAVFKLR
jgi:hypothetical protein